LDAPNTLSYGDNLDILRNSIPDASVDLIYLDPPFNSRRDYNVLIEEKSGVAITDPIEAFVDTREWGWSAELPVNRLRQPCTTFLARRANRTLPSLADSHASEVGALIEATVMPPQRHEHPPNEGVRVAFIRIC